MPNRIIRSGWLESDAIDQLSPHSERFFIRLCLVADDFGRYHADERILRSHLFPLKDDIRGADITRWIAECEKAGLIRCYEFASKRFIEIRKFQQRTRSSASKFPGPSDACPSIDGQLTVNCQTVDGHPRTEAEAETIVGDVIRYSEAEAAPPPPPSNDAPSEWDVLRALGRADCLTVAEKDIAKGLVEAGCLICDFQAAVAKTVQRGKPNRHLKYLETIVIEARDARLNPKAHARKTKKGKAHDIAGIDYTANLPRECFASDEDFELYKQGKHPVYSQNVSNTRAVSGDGGCISGPGARGNVSTVF